MSGDLEISCLYMLSQVKITIDGKDIFISRESAEELKKNL